MKLAYSLGTRERITPGELAPVRVATGDLEARWGLLPRWRGHGGKRGPMIYEAPMDRIAREPLLRDAFAKSRCAVLADGFYDDRPHAVWVHPASGTATLAGVFSINKDDGVPSFAVVVDRSFLVITDVDAWLDPKTSDPRTLLVEPSNWKTAPVGNRAQRELF